MPFVALRGPAYLRLEPLRNSRSPTPDRDQLVVGGRADLTVAALGF